MTRDTMEKTYNYAVIDDVHAREEYFILTNNLQFNYGIKGKK